MPSLNPYALLTILVFVGATIRACRREKIDPISGLKTGFSSAAIAWILVAGSCSFLSAELKLWTACIGAIIAYMGSEVLTALEKHGARVLSNPALLVADWMPPVLKNLLTLKSKNDDNPA